VRFIRPWRSSAVPGCPRNAARFYAKWRFLPENSRIVSSDVPGCPQLSSAEDI